MGDGLGGKQAMDPDIPDPDYDDPKEVYAFYGLAMYAAQLLEHSLLNLAAGLYLKKKPVVTKQIFDATFQDLDRKTLGQLLVATRSLTRVSEAVDAALQKALRRRNYLTHQFFRAHAAAFTHEKGRRLMLDELGALIVEFKQADAMVTPIYIELWKQYGVDEVALAAEIQAMKREVEARFFEP
jgi:hypothetical protein